MKRCASCGTTYTGSEKFCRHDGAPLHAVEPAVEDAVLTAAPAPAPAPTSSTSSTAAAGVQPAPAVTPTASATTPHTGRLSPDETDTVVGPMPTDPDETPPLGGRAEPDATPPMTAVPQVSAKLAALQGKTQPPPLPAKTTRKNAAPDLFVPPRSSPSGRNVMPGIPAESSQPTTQITALSPEDAEIQAAYKGKTIDGRYHIGRLIGHGGMGAVFECEQVHLKKRMAVKLLHENLMQKKALIARFQREARAISRLSSAHTVMVYDFGRWGELFFLVMELLEGDPLDAVLEAAGPLPPERVARIVLQMCDSLSEAHKNGIVHRDLKPENIMLVRSQAHPDFVKILDFGLAKVQGINDEDQVHSQRDIFGTPFFMSPEQIRAGAVDGRADIYAVGALMFRMLTGKHVFSHKNTFDILKAHLMDPVPKMATHGVQVPPALERIVVKALQKDPSSRFATMDEMALALAQTLRSGFRESGLALAAGSLELDKPEPPPKTSGKTDRGDRTRRNKAVRQTNLSNIAKLSDIFDPDELLQTSKAVERARLRWFAGGIAALVVALAGAWWLATPTASQTETEPNDEPARANALGPGDQSRGVIGKRKSDRIGDRDCFRLPGAPDGQDLEVGVRGVPNMDLQLTLYPESGKPVAINHRGRGQGELVRYWDPMKRPTLACVHEATQADQTPSESLSDQYTLSAVARALPAVAEREPNDDTPGNEARVDAGIAGLLEGPGDRDVFQVPGPSDGRLLRASLQVAAGSEPAGARLELYDGAGHLMVAHAARADQRSLELAFVGTTQQLPDHLIVARPGVADELAYTLTFALQPVADQAEREPNDGDETAQPLVLGAWHTGDFADGAQTDWLRIGGGDPGNRSARLEISATRGAVNVLVRDLGSKLDLRVMPVTDAQVREIVLNNATGQGLLVRVTPLETQGRKREPAAWRLRARTYANGHAP